MIELSCNDISGGDAARPSWWTTAEVRGVDWEFNAWGGLNGGLYFPWDQDALVAQRSGGREPDRYRPPMVLEGGAIHVDGEGTLLTTEECLLNPNRNPALGHAEIEEYLRAYLNVEMIIWLGRGVYNDETSGHINNLCCFVRPGVVALTADRSSGRPAAHDRPRRAGTPVRPPSRHAWAQIGCAYDPPT